MIKKLSACAEMSGMPRPKGLHRLRSENRTCLVTAANTLVEAIILAAQILEEGGDSVYLVVRASKVVRETAAREVRRLLGIGRRASDGSNKGTYESVIGW